LVNGGEISASTFASGNAGSVQINAGSIIINGQGAPIILDGTGIFSQAGPGSSGNAGLVFVSATGNLSIMNGGEISASTVSLGNGGTVQINANSIAIDGQGAQGNQIATGIFSEASPGSSGMAGSITVTTSGNLAVTNGGEINSAAFSSGNGGPIQVNATSIAIDGQGVQGNQVGTGIFSLASTGSSGLAGPIAVTASGNLSVTNGGEISSSTFSSGSGGPVQVNAASITIDGQVTQGNMVATGILSQAGQGTGSAGTVTVTTTGPLAVQNGGEIDSSTFSSGNAGTVQVSAATLVVDGPESSITAAAYAGSSGQTGNVSVIATNSITLSNDGKLSIQNFAYVLNPKAIVPTVLAVNAPTITLQNATITAASSGNVAASDIKISFSNLLYLDPSSISTSANQGNGGSISILGSGIIDLNSSEITTSVAGLSGNGGNISIDAAALIMNTGFIQANTAANAHGGLIDINVQTLVPSGNTLFVGGSVPYTFEPGVFGFNVIQAAAPTGVSGTIDITSPVLDITGSLRGLSGQTIDVGGLGRSLCQTSGGSSLAQAGRGGLAPAARGLLRTEPVLVADQIGALTPAADSALTIALLNWTCR
jgi:large exoprotein involved in heme utilization and adhesion